MHVVLAQARAGAEHPLYPAGEIHSALVFVDVRDAKEAVTVATRELVAAGWGGIQTRRVGEVNPESLSDRDQALMDSYEAATNEGFSIVVYGDADEDYAA